jgi:hypothetical protein
LLQEFQNFKDKFKNEDEAYEKGTSTRWMMNQLLASLA